jgi:hypothetical protein
LFVPWPWFGGSVTRWRARLIEVVAKADDSVGYRNEVRAAVAAFLSEIDE